MLKARSEEVTMDSAWLHAMPPLIGLVDLYCERTVDGLLAEPWNLFSNLAFFIAFFAVRRLHPPSCVLLFRILQYLILAIAVGSSLFHSFARFWALFLDVGPISLFMVIYVITWLTCVLRLKASTTVIITLLFVICTVVLRVFKIEFLNNSEFYFSPLLVIALLYLDRLRRRGIEATTYGIALAFFVAALFCRILDAHICPHFPTGTHFLWHIFNGGCLYYAMQGLSQALTPPGGQ